MNPEDPNQTAAQPVVQNPLSAMQPGEQIICEIKRHPIGILTIYIAEGFLLIVLAVISLIAAPNLFGGDNTGQVKAIGAIFFFIFMVVSLVYVFIATVVYWGNRWIVTSDSITQVTQTSLFRKQSSQLSLENLEDVTSEQNGILPHFLHYGILKAETAGERTKFVFLFCPNPNYYAQKILSAREVFQQTKNVPQPTQADYSRQSVLGQAPQQSQMPAYPGQPQDNTPSQPQPYPPINPSPDYYDSADNSTRTNSW